MRFGLLCSAQADDGDLPPESGQGFRAYLDLNVEAEALGFESSFLVEHHFTGWNQVSAPLMLLTGLAMRTTTLRLGTAVMVLPWHNPVLLAEQAATLDLLSNGRLDLGVGKGYRHSEFHGFGVQPDEADARFEEAIDVLIESWCSRARFSHDGRFWQFEDVVVEPPPAQVPYPPLWVAAASESSIRRAARRNCNLILDQYASTEQIAERIACYRAAVTAANGDAGASRLAVARQVYVARDRADADAALERLARFTQRTVDVSRAPGRTGGSHVLAYAGTPGATEQHAIFGAPDEIVETLVALEGAGVRYVLVSLFGGVDQLRRFARDVMPSFDPDDR
jgi:alkanesulfonate monooxygenase SsuD/methylene tetrahydromethanopterin reductase-like flavin-dependent oxidoreductase (luciferase family)